MGINKMLIPTILFFILGIGLVSATTSMNFLSKGFADTLYCSVDGTNCEFGNISINGSNGTGKKGDDVYIYNDTDTMYFNTTKSDLTYINTAGDTMTGDLDLDANFLKLDGWDSYFWVAGGSTIIAGSATQNTFDFSPIGDFVTDFLINVQNGNIALATTATDLIIDASTNLVNITSEIITDDNITAEYFIGDGSHLRNLNITSTTYYPISYWTRYGTESGGNNINNISFSDEDTFNITESAGANSIELYINFSGVNSTPDFITMGHQYIGTHEIVLEVWDYISLDWEIYDTIVQQGGIIKDSIALIDGTNHIDNSLVQVRFRHLQSGNPSHIFLLDFLNLVTGFSTVTTNEHDGLSGRNNESNHLWALPKSGGTIDGNLIITKNISINQSICINCHDFDGRGVGYINGSLFIGNDAHIQNPGSIEGIMIAPRGNFSNIATAIWLIPTINTSKRPKVNLNFASLGGYVNIRGTQFQSSPTGSISRGLSYTSFFGNPFNVAGNNNLTSIGSVLSSSDGFISTNHVKEVRGLKIISHDSSAIIAGSLANTLISRYAISSIYVDSADSLGGAHDVPIEVTAFIEEPGTDVAGNIADNIYQLGLGGFNGEYAGLFMGLPSTLNEQNESFENYTRVFSLAKTTLAFSVDRSGTEIMVTKINDTQFLINSSVSIGHDMLPTIYPLQVYGNNSNISIWAEANVSASGYTTRTTVFQGDDPFSCINKGDYYLDDNGEINHSKFCSGNYRDVPDYSRPVETIVPETKCNWEFDCNGQLEILQQQLEEGIINIDDVNKTKFIESNCKEIQVCRQINVTKTTYPYTKKEGTVSLNSEIDQLREAMAIHNSGFEIIENGTESPIVSGKTALFDNYVTNTTKDINTMNKVLNFRSGLNDLSFQEMKDIILDQYGKLNDNILMDYEKSEVGSYKLGALGHTNRAINILLIWENLQQEKEINELNNRLNTIESDLCNMGYTKYC